MKKRTVRGIHWPQNFGWHVGDQYTPPVRLASHLVRYEQEELGNEMGVPEFMLAEMDRLELRPRDVFWACLTKAAARTFARRGDGEPYRVGVGENALVLCTDDDGGFLLLFESDRLRPEIVALFEQYRADSAGCVPSTKSEARWEGVSIMGQHTQGQPAGESIEGEQVILTLPGGFTLCSGGEEHALGAYVRFLDRAGEEIVYWDKQEWADAPEEVMGAMLALLQDPTKLSAFSGKSTS